MRGRVLAILFVFLGHLLLGQKVINVNHVAFTVANLDRSIAFMESTVDAQLVGRIEIANLAMSSLLGIDSKHLPIRMGRMLIGNEEIRLIQFNDSDGRAIPHDSRSNDLWFQHIAIVVQDMNKAYNEVKNYKVEHVSTFPQTLPKYIPAAAGISAFYFRDRDDHNLELIYFPEGKGNPKWQNETSELFLGIDHTAIGISDTDKSLAFYKEVLGLQVAGNSENFGTEQEHLNQVFGARLLITGLHAEKGFGVEFLEYIAPPGGRIYLKDSSPMDLWHWHTAMRVDDLNSLYENLKQTNTKLVSNGIQKIEELDMKKALMVRDPDGHAILLYEQ